MRKIFLFFLAAFLVPSCKQDPALHNKEIVTQMFASFNAHDWEKMANFYAEPTEFLDPGFGVEYVTKTRKETVEKYGGYQRIIPDIKNEPVSIEAIGEKVIVEFISTGIVVGGVKMRTPMVSIFTLKDGVIVKEATYYDSKLQ